VSEAQQLPGWSVGSYVRRDPYWLVAKCRRGSLEVLTARLPDGRSMLPVFSFEDEATHYLCNGIRGSWQLRPTRAGELVSLLCSLCSKIDLVALDPMSDVETDVVNALVSLGRERFVDVLLRREAPAPLSPSSSTLPRLADGGRGVCAHTKGARKYSFHQVGGASVS
jgi:hypothetical protein